MKKVKKHTRIGAVLEDRFHHGCNLIFSNGSKTLKPFWGEKLKGAYFPDLDIVRSIISPNKILPISAKLGRWPASMPISKLLIIFLKHFLSQFRVGHNHVQRGPEPNRYDRAIGLCPLGKAPEPDWLYVIEVANDRPWTRAWWELES